MTELSNMQTASSRRSRPSMEGDDRLCLVHPDRQDLQHMALEARTSTDTAVRGVRGVLEHDDSIMARSGVRDRLGGLKRPNFLQRGKWP